MREGFEHPTDVRRLPGAIVDPGDDLPRGLEGRPALPSAEFFEVLQGHEVQVFVQCLQRTQALLPHRERLIRFADGSVDLERAEEGLIFGARFAAGAIPHVRREAGQDIGLVALPDVLHIGQDSLVNDRLTVYLGSHPSGARMDGAEVGVGIQVGAFVPRHRERSLPERRAAGIEGKDDVRWVLRGIDFEAH